MPLAFRPSLTVAPRLLCPYSTEDKAPTLMVKQLSTARNTQRNFQSYREDKMEEGDRGDLEAKRERAIKPVIKSLSENGY